MQPEGEEDAWTCLNSARRSLSGTIVYPPTAMILAFTSSLESQAVLLSVT